MNQFLKVVLFFLLGGLVITFPLQAGIYDLYYWTDATSDHQVGNVNNWDANYHSGSAPTHPADVVPGDGDIAIVASENTATINPTSNFTGSIVNELYVGEGTTTGWPFTLTPGPGHLRVDDATVSVKYWMTLGRVGASGTSTLDLYGGTLHDTDGGGRNVVGEMSTANMTLSKLVKIVEGEPVDVQSVWNTRSWTIVGWNAGAHGLVTLNDASTWNCLTNDITVGYYGAVDNPATAASGTVTLNNSSVLDMMGHGIVIGAENGSGTINLNGMSVLKANWLNTYSHASETSTLDFDGGTLVVTADNSNLYAKNAEAMPHIYVKAGGATIDTDGHAVGIWEPLENDTGSPGGGLTKLGLGKLTLSGASTYTGDTNVQEGILSVTGSVTSDVNVADGATLMGTGSIVGDVVASANSTLEGGDSVGTLTVTGDVTVAGTWKIEYDGDTSAVDKLIVTGTDGDLDLGSASISWANVGANQLANGTYEIAAYSGDTFIPPASWNLPSSNWSIAVTSGGSGTVSLVVVPEPSTIVLLAFGLIGLAAYLRRR